MSNFTFLCGNCKLPVVTYWSEKGLENGDYAVCGEVFFHKGSCLNNYLEEFTLGHLNSDPRTRLSEDNLRKGKNMNVETLGNAEQAKVAKGTINSLADLDGISAAELEKLIAIKAVDEPVDGTIIGYVTVDVADEADEDKTIQ